MTVNAIQIAQLLNTTMAMVAQYRAAKEAWRQANPNDAGELPDETALFQLLNTDSDKLGHHARELLAKYAATPFVMPTLVISEPVQPPPVVEPPPPPAPVQTQVARQGVVRIDHRTFVDDFGPFLAVGASLFWSPWGWKNDRSRLEDNLGWLGVRGVDYVRALAIVGPGGGWADRAMDPNQGWWDEAVAGAIDLAYLQGMRTQITIFGGIDTVPTRTQRRDVVARFINLARGREHKIILVELANEGWQNGFPGADGMGELKDLAAMVAAALPNLTSLTAPSAGYESFGQITGWHLDRSQTGTGNEWRPVRQPWEASFGGPWTNQEGIGIKSSVNEDDDPLRLTCYAINTWISRGAGFVLHHGAGIRGGGLGDQPRGRAANVWEQPTMQATLDGIAASRKLLPADLPNWTPQNSNDRFPGYPFDTDKLGPFIEREDLLRAFCAIGGDGRMAMLPIRVRGTVPFVARRRMVYQVHNPLTSELITDGMLSAGEQLVINGDRGAAFLVRGQLL